MTKPVVLVVMDGWGIAPSGPGNATSLAKTPNLLKLQATFPHTQLFAAGEQVGLPRGEAGNSEVGHISLGAGRIVFQDLPRINMAIADGTFFKNPAFLKVAQHVRECNSRLHLLGLVGAGGVHSSLEHLLALLHFAKNQNLSQVFLHLFTDGRDSPPNSAPIYISQIKDEIKKVGVGKIATISGRYFAMDRDRRWERTQKAYEVIVKGIGEHAKSPNEAIQNSYQKMRSDEFILPTVIVENDHPVATVSKNDGVVFFNFRIDRPRQLTEALVLVDFETNIPPRVAFDPYTEKYYKKTYAPNPDREVKTFPRGPQIPNLCFVTMTQYEPNLPVEIAFEPIIVEYPLSQVLSENQIKQFHIAETEKERFVTYYFDGQRETPFAGEDWMEIPSPKVATYDLKPEMSAYEVTDTLLSKINDGVHQFFLVNLANPDMVGHTAVIPAGIRACEVVDECVDKIVNQILAKNGTCIITADHGNVEGMINLQTGGPDTEHSANPVPFIAIDNRLSGKAVQLPTGILGDIAPTILAVLGIPKPQLMTGKNLLGDIL